MPSAPRKPDGCGKEGHFHRDDEKELPSVNYVNAAKAASS
jgi:hypothetical protein